MNLKSAVFLLASLAHSQSTTERFIVSGAVINSLTNDPVRQAIVHLYSPSREAEGFTRSDAAGRFTFPAIERGIFFVSPQREGFTPETPETRLTVGPQLTNDNLVLKLLPNATLSGKVLDENGDPVSLAMVTVMRRAIVSGRSQIQVMGGGSADDAGQYRIRIPQSGDYYVRAVCTRTPFSASAVAQWGRPAMLRTYAPTFYPGARDLASAVLIHLSTGQEMNADFDLRSQPAYRVRGRILNSPAANGFTVAFYPAGTPPSNGLPVAIDAKTSTFCCGRRSTRIISSRHTNHGREWNSLFRPKGIFGLRY